MRATIRRAVEAHKAQREENGEAGFSLIELIIVVVILGVLAAIAIPIFLNIQQDARNNAAAAVAANAATQAAASIAQDEEPDFSNLIDGDTVTGITYVGPTPEEVEDICIQVAYDGVENTDFTQAGPGCTTGTDTETVE